MKFRLNSVGIKPRLIGGFIIVALIAGLIGWRGLAGMTMAKKGYDEVATVRLPAIRGLNIIRAGQIDVRLDERTMLTAGLSEAEVREQVRKQEESFKEIQRGWEMYEPLPRTKEEAKLWQQFVPAYEEWKGYVQEIAQLVEAGKPDEARRLSFTKARSSYEVTKDLRTQLIELNQEIANNETVNFNNAFSGTRKLVITFVIIGIVAAITLGLLISLSVANPIKRLTDVADTLTTGDLDVDVSAEGEDEVAKLSGSLSKMVENIKAQANAVRKIAAGDLSVEVKAASKNDILANSIHQVVQSLKMLVNEASMLSEAAVEGTLDTRGDASKFEGGYKEIVTGVNATLDALVGHIDAMPAPAMIIDKDFSIRFMNETGASILGRTKQQLIGTKCYDHFKTSDCGTPNCACARAMQQKQPATSETDAHPAGMDLDISYTGVPVNDKQGNVIGALEIVTDQTAIKQAERLSKKIADYQDIEIEKLSNALARVAEGDLTAYLNVDSGDSDLAETRERCQRIADALNACVSAMRDAMVNVGQVTESVNESSRALSATAEEVSKASMQIAETSTQVAQGSQDQSKTVRASAEAMEQISRAIQEVAAGAQTQAQTVDQTVSLVQQITGAIEQVAKSAQDAAVTSQQVSDVATEGGKQVAEAVGSMDRIKEATDSVAQMVRQLGDSSQQIGAIVETIDDIAEQTNLLALNAAIEAARAGEHGKGFAVVADEVRKLAERSSKATGEIADLIGGIQQMTEHAVQAMERGSKEVADGTELGNQAGAALARIQDAVAGVVLQAQEVAASAQQMSGSSSEIIKAIESVSAVTEETTASTEEMAASSTEVSKQIEQVASVSQQNAAAAEEVSATTEEQNAAAEEMTSSAEELAKMAKNLQELVDRFKVTEDGHSVVLKNVNSDNNTYHSRKAA